MKCPNCKSQKIKKSGKRYNKYTGKIQRYYCKKCNSRFIIKSITYKMRHKRNIIEHALELRQLPMTYSMIAIELKNTVSRQTIMAWVHKNKDWKDKEVEVKKWCQGYWNKQYTTPKWVKPHYATYNITI